MLLITPNSLQLYNKPILAPFSTLFSDMKNTTNTLLNRNIPPINLRNLAIFG